MALILTIENETRLADGGPLSVTVTGKRGIDIGRDNHLDWTLPDPTRHISGKHCEIRYRDGGYWLHDVSTNGTFVNRSDRRVQGPHLLGHGDRIEIGRYIIAVTLEGEDAAAALPEVEAAAPAGPREFWAGVADAAPPIAAKDLLPPHQLRPVRPEFLDWAVDTPEAHLGQSRPDPGQAPPASIHGAASAAFEDMAWAQAPARAPFVPEPPPPVPVPRRPQPPEAANPWGAPSLATPPAERAARQGEPPPQAFPAAPAYGESAPPFAAPSPPLAYTEPAPRPAPDAAPAPGGPAGDGDLVSRLARGAGVSEDVFARRDPGELAEELGALVRIVAENVKQLLAARAETKRVARSAEHTMIQAMENNPLKFSPTAEDAMRLMFGPPTRGYLDARRTFEQSFKDLKTHQVKTYSAMQHALRMLAEDLDPQVIEGSREGDKGLGGLIGSRKARLWDAYVARWDAMTAPHEDGMVEAFMIYFSECYDRGAGGGR